MKFLFAFLPLLFISVAASATCPDLSGTYSWQLRPDDGRKIYRFKITQKGCESITLSDWYIKWSGGQEFKSTADQNRTDLIDNQFHGRVKNSWMADGIEVFETDINSAHCNEHGMWKVNSAKNSLDYIWRFECPNGNSDWLTPETPTGWTGQRYLKMK
jgi:hypothetical protein